MYKTAKMVKNVYITILQEVHIMNTSNMKKMIVLKDLPSNIVEEAIVILKSNINIKNYEFVENKNESKSNNLNKKEKSGNYIIKEAENVISNYISNIEKPREIEKKNSNLQKKYNRLRGISIFWAIIANLAILINIIK